MIMLLINKKGSNNNNLGVFPVSDKVYYDALVDKRGNIA